MCWGGGVGVRERGKLATSLVTDNERIEPNVWSGDRLAPTLCTIPLLKENKNIIKNVLLLEFKFFTFKLYIFFYLQGKYFEILR